MRLSSPEGVALDLEILGYQFPHLHDVEFDSNWLNVSLTVSHPRGNWSATDASLLTHEASRLASWLDAASSGATVAETEDFLEPELEFRLAKGVLLVGLRNAYRAPWATEAGYPAGEFYLSFPREPLMLKRAVWSLREALRRYPQRTPQ